MKVRRAASVFAYLAWMKRRYVLTAGSVLVAASAIVSVPVIARTADAPGGKPNDKRAWVRVMDNFFDPRSASVAPGTKVTFTWRGTNRHNVRFTRVPQGVSRKGSKILRHGRWSRMFTQPGVYRYICTVFSGMRGTITVTPPTPSQAKGAR